MTTRQERWASPLGEKVTTVRRTLEALALTRGPTVAMAPAYLEYVSELLADVLEEGAEPDNG